MVEVSVIAEQLNSMKFFIVSVQTPSQMAYYKDSTGTQEKIHEICNQTEPKIGRDE